MEDCSSVIVVGGSGSGKTTFVINCIKNLDRVYENPPVSVHYYYGIFQPIFDELENNRSLQCKVYLQQGPPSEEDIAAITSDGQIHMIVLDDQLFAGNNADICRLFTETSHHSKVNVWLLLQNLFMNQKYSTTISRNAHYFVFTKSPRNTSTVMNLAKQVFPGKNQALMEAYEDIMKEPYGIMVLDLHPKTDSKYRISSSILDQEPAIYIPH